MLMSDVLEDLSQVSTIQNTLVHWVKKELDACLTRSFVTITRVTEAAPNTERVP